MRIAARQRRVKLNAADKMRTVFSLRRRDNSFAKDFKMQCWARQKLTIILIATCVPWLAKYQHTEVRLLNAAACDSASKALPTGEN